MNCQFFVIEQKYEAMVGFYLFLGMVFVYVYCSVGQGSGIG